MPKKTVALCMLLASLACILQYISIPKGIISFPALLAAGLPVYLAARIGSLSGAAVFFAVSLLSALKDMGSALFFICVTGSTGLALGIASNMTQRLYLVPLPAVLLVFLSLEGLNKLLGLCILGGAYGDSVLMQALALLPVLYPCCLLQLNLYMLAEKKLRSSLELDNY